MLTVLIFIQQRFCLTKIIILRHILSTLIIFHL